MALFRNPPVEDTAGGEADKSLRSPCEMQSLFLWGQSSEFFVPARGRDAQFLDFLDLAKNC